MKKNIILFGLIVVMILAGCSQDVGKRISRTVEVNGKPVDVSNAQDYIVNISGSQNTNISEITITQPDNSKTQIEASVENRLVERNGAKIVLTTVTIEETGPAAGIPWYVWVLLAIIVILVIITIISCSNGSSDSNEEKESEPEPEVKQEPVVVPVVAAAAATAAVATKKKTNKVKKTVVLASGLTTQVVSYGGVAVEVIEGKGTRKYMPKIYGIDSIRDLINVTKNTAQRTDDIQQRCSILEIEISEINDRVKQIESETFPDEAKREKLLEEKETKHDVLVYLRTEGRLAEISNDDYAYLLKRLTDEDSDFRETERFNEEKVISVTDYDVTWLKNHIEKKK